MMPGEEMEIIMNRINPLKLKSLELAEELLRGGRPVGFVKFVTNITVVEMLRQGWLYEIKIPQPDGKVISTGQFRSVFPPPVCVPGPSNKQRKRENRKAFFASRRLKAA